MPDLYREFVLRDEADARAMWQFVKSNAKPFAERGQPLRIIATDEDQDRLDEQIAYYFGVVIKSLVENAWADGQRFSKKAWHEYMAEMFLPPIEMKLPNGETKIRRQSIARGEIGVKAMAKFTQEVEAYAATEHGIEFEDKRVAA